jgi:prophage antirepressor-like protein
MCATLESFSFEGQALGVVQSDGQPWFVANSAATILGLKGNGAEITRHLDEDEIKVISNHLNQGKGSPRLTIISESGLYALILRSRKPEAKRFRKWVTSEVLPAIRKTGAYAAQAPDAPRGPVPEVPDVPADRPLSNRERDALAYEASYKDWLRPMEAYVERHAKGRLAFAVPVRDVWGLRYGGQGYTEADRYNDARFKYFCYMLRQNMFDGFSIGGYRVTVSAVFVPITTCTQFVFVREDMLAEEALDCKTYREAVSGISHEAVKKQWAKRKKKTT